MIHKLTLKKEAAETDCYFFLGDWGWGGVVQYHGTLIFAETSRQRD